MAALAEPHLDTAETRESLEANDTCSPRPGKLVDLLVLNVISSAVSELCTIVHIHMS